MKIIYSGSDLKFLTAAFSALPEEGHTISKLTATHIMATHPDTGLIFSVYGTDMAFVDDDLKLGPIGGTVTEVFFAVSGYNFASFEDISWSFIDFIVALDGFDTTPGSFDALMNEDPIEFDGSGASSGIDLSQSGFSLTNSPVVIGSRFGDTLSGSSGMDTIKGRAGADIVKGGNGKDLLAGGGHSDQLFGGLGGDRINGGSQMDVLFGGKGNDRLFGGKGFDTLNGGAGKDMVKGGGSADELHGNGGNDLMFGDMGSDLLYGGKGSDTMFGGNGGDDLIGGAGTDALHGGAGTDALYGGDGNDTLFGGDDLDSLRGGRGDDTFFGGQGTDDMSGGTGSDVFVYNSNATDGEDVIYDFRSGKDLIRITDGYSFADLKIQSHGEDDVNTTIIWGVSEILLFNVEASSISAADFDFL